jgi:Fe-S-cluster containining protein
MAKRGATEKKGLRTAHKRHGARTGSSRPTSQPHGASAKCRECIPAKCCMYLSVEVDAPETKRDFDDLLWMIAHRDVEIYTRRRRWYLMVKNPCRFYDPRHGCTIYPVRPRICRQHHPDECEFDEGYDFDLHFRSYEELDRHIRKNAST